MPDLRNQTLNRLGAHCVGCAPLPTPTMPLSVFEDLLYTTAKENAFAGDKQEFLNAFTDSLNGATPSISQYNNFANFPAAGREGIIYIDEQKGELYYWDGAYQKVKAEAPENENFDGGEI